MKRLCLVIIVVVGIVVTWIGSDALAQQKTIKLTYSDHNPPNAWCTVNGTEPWLKRVEEATKGAVKIERYYAESLAKGTDAWMGIKTGVADMAWCAHGYWAGVTPLSDVITLPFLPFKNGRQAAGILWKLREKYPEIQKEYADVHVLVFHCTPPVSLLTSKKQVKTLEDLKGLKLRMLAGPPTDVMKSLGAVPLMLGMPDVYLAMQKGTIDGSGIPLGTLEIFNLYEVGKYWTHMPITTSYFTNSMNKAKWNSLPPDVQKAITSVCGYEGSRKYAYDFHDSYDEPVRKEMADWVKKGGHKLEEYVMPKAELDRWIQVGGKPVWERWVANMEAKGLPGKAVLADTLKLIETEP
ncbi:MAG: TRAP transporter substrate-binding protein [Thermodesulfobacteriota bacterium]